MERSNELKEILDLIKVTLKAGRDEITFRKSELDSNPAKKSAIDQLSYLGVISARISLSLGNTSFRFENNKNPFPKRHVLPRQESGQRVIEDAIKIYDREVEQYWDGVQQDLKELEKLDGKIVLKINKEQFDKLYKDNDSEIPPSKKIKSVKTLIIKDVKGIYYFNGRIIKFKNENSIYYKIFDCLFHNSNLNDGFCSYEDIDSFLQENGEVVLKDNKKIIKRINNGKMSLFRFTENLPERALDGQDVITVVRGNGLKMYNPVI